MLPASIIYFLNYEFIRVPINRECREKKLRIWYSKFHPQRNFVLFYSRICPNITGLFCLHMMMCYLHYTFCWKKRRSWFNCGAVWCKIVWCFSHRFHDISVICSVELLVHSWLLSLFLIMMFSYAVYLNYHIR